MKCKYNINLQLNVNLRGASIGQCVETYFIIRISILAWKNWKKDNYKAIKHKNVYKTAALPILASCLMFSGIQSIVSLGLSVGRLTSNNSSVFAVEFPPFCLFDFRQR